MLTDTECSAIEKAIISIAEPRSTAAYLCLNMGLSIGEAAGLKWGDIDFVLRQITIRRVLTRNGKDNTVSPVKNVRSIIIPPHVSVFLRSRSEMYAGASSYVMSGEDSPSPFYVMQNMLNTVAYSLGMTVPLSSGDLRDAFIRHAFESGADLYTVCSYCGVNHPETLIRKFGGYLSFRATEIMNLEPFSSEKKPNTKKDNVAKLRLLVIGAGRNMRGVARRVRSIGIFDDVRFLDDGIYESDGHISECVELAGEYQAAIVCFDDSHVRKRYMDLLESHGYAIPSFLNPGAVVSHSAEIGRSVMVGDRAKIGDGTVIGRGVTVANGAVIESGVRIGEFSYVGTDSVVEKNTVIPPHTEITSGRVVHRSDYD